MHASNPFFQQWLFRAGHPHLDIRWQYDARKKQVKITVIQKQPELYQLPLALLFDNKELKEKVIQERETSFVFPFITKPSSIIADPNINMLFEHQITEQK